jgi:4-hydroxybenzoate polyprenyltransferase
MSVPEAGPAVRGRGAEQARLAAELVRLARPAHWIKSGFVLMPLPFAIVSGATVRPYALAAGVLGFCLIASSVYVLNDLLDAPADRLHPLKRLRPIAAGAVPARVAALFGILLAAAGFELLILTETAAPWLGLLYGGINIAYSLGAKRQALLDVFILSSGFVIRVVLGCVLVRVVPSNWLLLCSSSLALFLGFAKRRGDLQEGVSAAHRPSLAGYSIGFLDHGMTIAACIALLSYALYSIESEVLLAGREMAPMPFVVYGVLYYLREAHTRGAGSSPVDLALRSPTIWICMAGWGLSVMWSLGMW